jgi:hypothetical protein
MVVASVPPTNAAPKASMIRYAGIFLGSHFCGVLLLGALIRVVGIPRPPLFGLWLILGAAYLVSYLFARRQRRVFTPRETWQLIIYCSVYAVLFELYAEFSALAKVQSVLNGLPADDATFLAIVAISCLANVLTLVVFFEFGAPRTMRSYLDG